MSDRLPCVEVEPQTAADSAIIWLHGLGASGHDFEPIVPALNLPRTRFVFPHAPPRPVTLNQGWVMPAWYDIISLDRRADRENEDDIRASAEQISTLLEYEHKRGIPYERIVLAGFSQGAAMTLFAGSRFPHRLAGLMSLSGYMVVESSFESERLAANQNTPVLFCHGTLDPTVPVQLGEHAYAAFKTWSTADLTWRAFSMTHEVNAAEVAVIRAWLAERLSPRD